MNEQRIMRLRIALICTVFVGAAMAIAIRLFTIQLVEGSRWLARADKVATAFRSVESDRGHIYSDDGRLLATSVPEYEVRMDLRADGLTDALFHAHVDSLGWYLSRLFNDKSSQAYARELMDARARGERYHRLKQRCDHLQLQELETFPLFRLGRYTGGLIAVKRTERIRPCGRLARRTIGWRPQDGVPYGIEAGYDEWLRGITGRRLERRLSGGVWMPIDDGNGQDPEPGSDVHTTIDVNLQDVADNALAEQLREHRAHHGCVVVMEVATGYVKAISNLTRRNDSTYVDDENYAVGHATEPGSTFKIPAIIVAMEDGRVKLDDIVDTRGGKVRYYDRVMTDSHEEGYGQIPLSRALELSTNSGVSRAINQAYKTEPQRFVEGLRRMGLNEPLGLRIPGEGMPVLRGPEDKAWSGVSLPYMSIGYEVMLTPMQTLAFYNAIANGGRFMQPQFVTRVTRAGREVKRFDPVVLRERICSDRTLEQIRGVLEGVVDSGTATNLRDTHLRIAGKTGTAQIAHGKLGYKQTATVYQASFVGYFPAEAPRYSCIVVVSSPSSSGYYGNLVAGPVFMEIAEKIHSNRLELQTGLAHAGEIDTRSPVTFSGDRRDLLAATAALGVAVLADGEGEWVSTQAGDSVVTATTRTVPGDATGLVPNVLGMGAKDALYVLENRGLRVRMNGAGMVKKQSLTPGSRCQHGSHITIELTL